MDVELPMLAGLIKRTLINFLMDCSFGISFFQYVNVLDVVKGPKNIVSHVSSWSCWVMSGLAGPANVVQVESSD